MISSIKTNKYFSSHYLILWISVLLVVVKLCFLPFVQTVDADAVSRVLLSEKWLANPHLITDGVWAPLHFYFNAIVLWLTDSRVIAPKLLNILFSSLAIVPFYHFVRRIFEPKGALFSAILLGLSPIIFRNGFQALSGAPYLFFTCLSLYYLAKALYDSEDVKNYIFAGLAITIAAGLRYEAWVLIACFTLIILLHKKWKETMFFWLAAMVFPLFWMLVGLIYHDDILFGVNGAYTWNIELMGVNEEINDTERIRRVLFFPFSWFLAVSPFISWVIIYTFFRTAIKKEFTRPQLIWLIPLLVIIFSFLAKTQNGTLLMQHRFTASWIVFSAPLLSLFFKQAQQWKKVSITVMLLIMPFMSYFWYSFSFSDWTPLSDQMVTVVKEIELSAGAEALPLPSFMDDVPIEIKDVIVENTTKDDGLLIDFTGWSKTYYWALNSYVPAGDICIFQGAKNGAFDFQQFHEIVNRKPEGVLVLYCGSDHINNFSISGGVLSTNSTEFPVMIGLDFLYAQEGVSVFRYVQVNGVDEFLGEEVHLDCPEEGSREFFIMSIKNNTQMFNDVHKKAFKNGITFEEMLERDVEYLMNL